MGRPLSVISVWCMVPLHEVHRNLICVFGTFVRYSYVFLLKLSQILFNLACFLAYLPVDVSAPGLHANCFRLPKRPIHLRAPHLCNIGDWEYPNMILRQFFSNLHNLRNTQKINQKKYAGIRWDFCICFFHKWSQKLLTFSFVIVWTWPVGIADLSGALRLGGKGRQDYQLMGLCQSATRGVFFFCRLKGNLIHL